MSAPTIESYHPAAVDPTLCIGRRYTIADRRWSPMVYGARQCKVPRPSVKDPSAGDLCEKCCTRRDSGKLWDGVVTDMASLPAKSHIAGSAWFLSRKPTWLGTAAPKKTVKTVKAMEAMKAIPKEVAPAGDEPIGWLTIIDGEFYWVLKGNVYHYDPIEEVPGDFVGCLRADESIDVDAEEVIGVVEAPVALRTPKGLWADLEETIIKQDRICLMDCAQRMGLSPALSPALPPAAVEAMKAIPVIAKEKKKKIPRRDLMTRIAELDLSKVELERRNAELEQVICRLRNSFLQVATSAAAIGASATDNM